MTIQPIGSASVALYITPADLKEHGLTPAGLTLERALALTQSAFSQAGIALDGSIEIEAYPDTCGVLVFARIKPPERFWFSFDSLESLLAGIACLPAACEDSALLWSENRWWISLPGQDSQAANLLSEFGRSEEHRPYLEANLEERGTLILPQSAIPTLRNYFLPPSKTQCTDSKIPDLSP